MTCNQDLQNIGRAYPNPCADCGTGPCKKYPEPNPPNTGSGVQAPRSDTKVPFLLQEVMDTLPTYHLVKNWLKWELIGYDHTHNGNEVLYYRGCREDCWNEFEYITRNSGGVLTVILPKKAVPSF